VITYAGIRLPEPPDDVLAWVEQVIPPDHLDDLTRRTWPGKNLTHLPWYGRVRERPVVPQTLAWPANRASECAVGYFLAADSDVDAIRQQVYQGNGYLPQTLTLTDGTRQVSALLYMLPARPLSQVAGRNALQLLTLVDQRYFWWQRAADVAVTPGTTTWADLYAAIGAALGVSIQADPVDPAYLKPAAGLGQHYEALPPLLDAVALSCGQRTVCGLDGTVRALNYASSQALLAQNLTLGPRVAGGLMALTPG
jgi:hypothetical protein